MLTEFSGHLTPKKLTDLTSRLEHVNTKTALAAEAELAVVWAISRVAHIVSEPVLPNSTSRPEAGSTDLFRSGPAVIEVRALSDDSFSGKDAMERTANVVAAYTDRLRKGAGKNLYFEFMERSYWMKRFHRERCVDPRFQLTEGMEGQLRKWITASDWPNSEKVRITHGKTDVIVSWRQYPGRLTRTFCSMPAVAYDLEENPIYKALKSKSGQVRGAADGTLRCVVLVDAGCDLLRRLRTRPGAIHEISGETIIRHVLRKLSIDTVIVLSPYRHQSGFISHGQSELLWNVSCFDRRESVPDGEYDRIEQMASQLPRPRFEGYQARALHAQGSFARNGRNWYLATQATLNGEKMTIRVSASLLHEYLAGRIDADRFRQRAFNNEKNFFDLELARGNAIRKARFESGGIDEDDDYVVFDLDVGLLKTAESQRADLPQPKGA